MDSKDVQVRLKPEAAACVCGCGVIGRLLAKATSKGEYHVARCRCISHRNGRNRKNGLRAQSKAAKALGVPASKGFIPSDEEFFGGFLRAEIKSGAQVRPMHTAFEKAWLQSDKARAIGDARPIVVVAKLRPNGNDGIVSFRISDMEAVSYALALNLGLLDA